MKTLLNSVQLEQVADLVEVVNKEYAGLMVEYTHFITSEELDSLYSETVEFEEIENDSVHCMFDMNYHSVASDYAMIDNDTIRQAFGFYGEYSLYMDELGRGLVVGYY